METTTTTRPDEPGTTGDKKVVETEVETVRTRQRVAGTPVDAIAETPAMTHERTGGYFETLPERLRAVMVVLLIALEGLLSIRFLLFAFGANTTSGFVGFIDDVSWPFVRPFANAFSNRSWDQGIIEVSTLVAMAVYLLVFVLVAMLITALAPRLSGYASSAA